METSFVSRRRSETVLFQPIESVCEYLKAFLLIPNHRDAFTEPAEA